MKLLCCIKMVPNNQITKKWEVFAGRNKFYCDGILMTAPNSSVFYLTVFLITGTSALFFAFDCPFLAIRITPVIPAIGGILYLFTMSSLLRTSFSDPGVIPRASNDEASFIEKQIEVPNSLNSPTYRPPPRTKEVLVRGQTVKLKYCFTCKIFRPPRASHCSLCDNCVDRFDHHCPWVGNCVGKRNYRFFYMFIVSLAFLTVFIFSCAMTHIILLTKDNEEFIEAIKRTPVSVVVVVICFFSVWSVIGLAGFHTYLTTSDQTTNEDIKGSFSSKGGQHAMNPYAQKNICLNCFHILCGPLTPSLIDRRGLVTDEYRTQMQSREPMRYSAPVAPVIVNQAHYATEMENMPPSIEIFRQRSYDNLHSGNSNSASQLIEHEIAYPISNGISLNDTPRIGDSVDHRPSEHLNNIDNTACAHHNNTIRDNKNDDRVLGSHHQTAKNDETLENVYSNIITPATIKHLNVQEQTNNLDHSLHVYSNITSSTPNSQSNLFNSNFNNQNNVATKIPSSYDKINANNINGEITKSTVKKCIADELDLDDPVIVTSSFSENKFAKNRACNNNKLVNPNFQNHNDTMKIAAVAAAAGGGNNNKSNSTINSKDIPHEIVDLSKMVLKDIIDSKNPLPTPSSAHNTSSQSLLSPSRMRMLQDTTMIDTALDLDSLDGSSINSVAKTLNA